MDARILFFVYNLQQPVKSQPDDLYKPLENRDRSFLRRFNLIFLSVTSL
jgi:hypothetical protein